MREALSSELWECLNATYHSLDVQEEASQRYGPFQFLRHTFFTTPTGAGGGDWRDPYDQVDAAAEMLRQGRAREGQVVQRRLC